MKIPIIFLGTAQAIPTIKRNHTSIYFEYKDEAILVDCGEGTQRQFRKAGINPCKITRILITHWHGDHILGLPGLLQTLALNGYNRTLRIYGPKHTKDYLEVMFRFFVPIEKIKIEVEEIESGILLNEKDFFIEAFPMKHGAKCNAYSFVEKDKIRINKDKLKKLKLPNSPLLKKLQQGHDIEYQGRKIKAKELTYEEKGKKITFILDTALIENCYKAAKDADLLISEATYMKDEEERAQEYMHLTAEQAAEIAKKAKTKKLILTHISQRYDLMEKELLAEARKVFKNAEIAHDLMKVEI